MHGGNATGPAAAASPAGPTRWRCRRRSVRTCTLLPHRHPPPTAEDAGTIIRLIGGPLQVWLGTVWQRRRRRRPTHRGAWAASAGRTGARYSAPLRMPRARHDGRCSGMAHKHEQEERHGRETWRRPWLEPTSRNRRPMVQRLWRCRGLGECDCKRLGFADRGRHWSRRSFHGSDLLPKPGARERWCPASHCTASGSMGGPRSAAKLPIATLTHSGS